MWRGRSDGDEDSAQSRRGPAQSKEPTKGPKSRGKPRQSPRGGDRAAPGADPRSRETGKKIRRIESGASSGGQAEATRRRDGGNGPSLAARGQGRPSEQTDIGPPPSAPPGQLPSAPLGRGREMGGRPSGMPAGRASSLPPLNQSTGELPKVPSQISADAEAPSHPGFAAPGAEVPTGDNTVVVAPSSGGVFAEQRTEQSGFDAPMPSALPPMDDPVEQVVDATGVIPAMPAVDGLSEIDLTDGGLQREGIRGDLSPTNPFPDTPSTFPGTDPDPEAPRAPETRSFDGQPMAAAGAIGGAAAFGAPADARNAPPAMDQPAMGVPMDRQGAHQRRSGPNPGVGPAAAGRPRRSADADAANRLQDTEFKLADKRRKQKPKEPNKLILGLAAALVVLVGVAVAFLLTRGDDATNDQVAAEGDPSTDDVPEAAALDDASAPPEVATTVPEIQVDEPTLVFEAAQTGPLRQGDTYSIDLLGEPEGALLQVVVDGLPQGDPAPQLPDLILPAGRHSLVIQITNGAEQSLSTPAEVYVIGDPPPAGYRVNLSSVDMQAEGWVDAIRQFDEFRAAGHEGLQLAPISPGFWNIFVGGLGEEQAAALSYCESFGLAVPDECFGVLVEPSDAAGSTATTVAEGAEDTTTTVEAMEDSTTVTTAAGG